MHPRPPRGRRGLHLEEAPRHDRHGRFRAVRGSSGATDAIKEGDMAVEDKQGSEQTVEADEADEADVELHATPDVADDDVEAHVWRAQS